MAKFEIKDGVAIIPEGTTEIGDDAFMYCSSLKSITIPEGVTVIGKSAFCGCTSLESISIPESVTEIKSCVFCDCTSLTSIIFQGTIEQWNEIDFGDGWNDEVPTEVIHCTDGDVEI